MKIVIENSIPFIRGVFEPYCDVVYREGSEITHNELLDVDAMIIRTRTRCNAALLDGTGVKMIATASIGTDNIDKPYCASHHIFVQNAGGCNAGGVMDYVFSALYGCAARKSVDITGATIGIVGCGDTGSRVEAMARSLGHQVLLCDPPRAACEGPDRFVSLGHLLSNSDVVTMHVPMDDTTRRMCNADFFAQMKFGSFFINTARGEIVDEAALIEAAPKFTSIIIDTWINEPDINLDLMKVTSIATPHIAGYSYQGKLNSTLISVRGVARYFGIKELYDFTPKPDVENMESVRVDVSNMGQGKIASIFQYNYPIFTDDFMFRMDPKRFKQLRAEYKYRREFFIE